MGEGGLPCCIGLGDMAAVGQSLSRNSIGTLLVCERKVGRPYYQPLDSYRHSDQFFILALKEILEFLFGLRNERDIY